MDEVETPGTDSDQTAAAKKQPLAWWGTVGFGCVFIGALGAMTSGMNSVSAMWLGIGLALGIPALVVKELKSR